MHKHKQYTVEMVVCINHFTRLTLG